MGMSLRELLDKQAAEKAAVDLAKPKIEEKTEPPKAKGFLARIGAEPAKPNGEIPREQAVSAMTTIINTVVPVQDLPQSTINDLRKNLDFLAENIDQKNLVGQVVRTIAVQLQENPQFSSCMKDPDFDLLVRGLRKSYQIAARRRVEIGEKKEEKNAEVAELEAMMKDMGVSLKF